MIVFSYFRGMFCIVDIESTGGAYGKEGIIEIAIYRYDGDEVVDQLISLVHPERSIQPYVTKITGIDEKSLRRAPRFHELAKRIIEITEDAVIVGHNVEFDYRMMRQEYSRLGYVFERKTLDTIKLAEQLIPGLKSYGLDRICDELGIFRTHKHRADSDARATLELLRILQEKDRKKNINMLGQSVNEPDALKDKLNDLRRSVKKERGLFYLYDSDGKLLYIGVSDNVRQAVNKLMMAESKELVKLKERVHSITVESVGNDLIGLVKLYEELEKGKPPFNTKKPLKFHYGIYKEGRGSKLRLFIKPIEQMGKKKPVVKTLLYRHAQKALRLYKRMSEEDQQEVLQMVLDFKPQALYYGKGRETGEHSAFYVNEQQLEGYYYYSLNEELTHKEKLLRKLSPVHHPRLFTPILKQLILSGELKPIKSYTPG